MNPLPLLFKIDVASTDLGRNEFRKVSVGDQFLNRPRYKRGRARGEYKLDLGILSQGIYFLEILNAGSPVLIERIIKQ